MSSVLETAKILLSSLRWNDIVDIIIVAYIVYKLIIFVRDSRSALLFKGIIIICIAFVVSSLLQLEMVSYLLDMIVSNLALAIIVIFQPELRHVLERVGKSRLSSFRSFFLGDDSEKQRSETLNTISSVVETTRVLKGQLMGALIVFERDVPLNDIVATGSLVDALPGVSVLSNIFFTKAPLHDGAVIIRNNRICAAGCLLPLTQRSDIDSRFGTRHRAGIGITEQTDAVAVVLSEETGRVSICVNGEINSTYDFGELSVLLIRALIPGETELAEDTGKGFRAAVGSFFKRLGRDIMDFIKPNKVDDTDISDANSNDKDIDADSSNSADNKVNGGKEA